MKIDLHIHTSTGSDGAMPVEKALDEAKKRDISMLSITDHDSIAAQAKAKTLAKKLGIKYITGIELNVTFPVPQGKVISLDFLGYGFDINNRQLTDILTQMRNHREWRAQEILRKINIEMTNEGIQILTPEDMENIKQNVDGAFGRPHLAAYLVKKGIVNNTQQAFDKYLVKCDVPKYPLSLADASRLIRDAGGILILAHPNDPHGTSLRSATIELEKQTLIIRENMLKYINGVECWHSRHDEAASTLFFSFTQENHLLCTGGSDCHQKPVIMGTVDVPKIVAEQLSIYVKE